jgi:tetratricopeptide (TPR) repeat protein
MARLLPNDPEILGNLAGAQLMLALFQAPPDALDDFKAGGVDSLAAMGRLLKKADRAVIEGVMAKLEKLTINPDPLFAEPAFRYLGQWLMVMGEPCKAEEKIGKAIALKPKCQLSWDLLYICKLGAPEGEKRNDQAGYEVIKKELEHLPTAQNHLQLARVCVNLERLEEAEKVLHSGLERFPEDLYCRLGLAAVLLRSNGDPAAAVAVKKSLDRVRESLKKQWDQSLVESYWLSMAICQALTGDLGHSREALLFLREKAPDFEEAKKAIELFSD